MPTDPYTLRERLIETLDTEFGNWQWDSVAPEMSAGRYVADALLPLITQTVAAEIEKAADEVAKIAPIGCEMDYTGKEDPVTAAWVEGLHDAYDALRARAVTIREEGLTA